MWKSSNSFDPWKNSYCDIVTGNMIMFTKYNKYIIIIVIVFSSLYGLPPLCRRSFCANKKVCIKKYTHIPSRTRREQTTLFVLSSSTHQLLSLIRQCALLTSAPYFHFEPARTSYTSTRLVSRDPSKYLQAIDPGSGIISAGRPPSE